MSCIINTYNSSWRNHPNFSWKARATQYQQPDPPSQQSSSLEQAMTNLSKVVGDFVGKQEATNAQIYQRIDRVESMLNKRMDGMQNDMNQKFDNIQYSISRLTNLNTLQEKGRFPFQPHQNPKGVHEVGSQEGESSQMKDVKALITLRSEKELLKEEMLKKSTSPPFPQALHGKKGVRNAVEILEVLRQVKVNIPLLDMIKQVPTYAKFLKDLCTIKRRLTVNKKAFLTEQVSAILQCKSPLKYKDPGSPTISVMIGGKVVEKALLDLGASVNLLPYSVYKQLGLGELKPTAITLSLADRSVKIPRGVIDDVLVQVDNFYYPVDFIVLDTDPTVKEANLVPIILGRPFLATSNAIINCRNGLMQLTFGNMTLDLNIFYMSKKKITSEEEEGPEELCIIDTLVEEHCNQNMQDKLNESLVDFEEGLSESPTVLATLQSWKKIEEILPLFNEGEEAAADKEPPKFNPKPLPVELKYTYLEENNQCPVVISSSLTSHQENCLMEVLKRCKKAIGWQISNLKDISPLVCTHHIYMEEEAKPIRQLQRRLNPHLQEVVQAEIEIDVADQEKTTFTCPFGTYAYRRMPFGLCNAPATFQRCMLSIFSDMVERIMEVFMDDITVYGGTFEECLVNLEAVLHRCIEKDLVLNWEKCHFMVHQGIVLGHIISEKGIEVDKAKVELIVKLPSPTTVKGVRQFLGHAGFYRRFIKGFSSLSKPLCELLAKDAKFIWDERCQNNFDQLKKFLTTTPIVRVPNWQLPFELMCDASDFAIGAVLGQREDGKPYVIYYASKTLNEAQRNYTTTEKELLAVVFRNCESDFWHTCATSHHSKTNFAAAKRIAKVSKSERPILADRPSPSSSLTAQASGHFLRPSVPAKFRQPEMVRTRRAKSSSPSNRKRSLRKEPVPDPVSEPSQPKATPPPVKPAPPKPPARRYLTRSGGWPLQKRPRVESSEPIDLTEQSPEPSPIPTPAPTPVPSPVPSPMPSPAPQAKSQEPQAPLPEPQIPSEIAPGEVIRRPMLTQPPIKGNLDCRARQFHSELCFDIAAFRLQPELAQTFNLLRRYHMEHLLTPRDFFYPRIAMDFYQSMTTNQHWTQRRGILLEALYKMSEGFFFGPHHLILAALLYFEEKVHKKKLQRADCIPLLFPRLLCQILEHLGYPSEPQLERKRICRELFTLDKWNNMTTYRVDQPERPQPAARRASTLHIPEGITVAAPAIPKAPPAAPASSQPSTSAEPRMVIPISKYRELCCALETLTASQSSLAQEMAAIRACQEQMLATQAQQAAILRQLQLHFDLPPAVEPFTSTPVVPHSHPSESHPLKPQAPAEAPTEEADPSA
ncbi:Retrovirus-related Pol polyprotein from transposon 17.6 [Vitis vinifera]|uniref:Retrovirus-related Pol polyprotein from transposon 17.6 n=1 Tax=Vitis vinifera TaxID=29760 RepID=A0A438IFR3_VITVI|nr:Retrovirus-related Pol polyprotein from transposon 17.6 [Vitis vinifera]